MFRCITVGRIRNALILLFDDRYNFPCVRVNHQLVCGISFCKVSVIMENSSDSESEAPEVRIEYDIDDEVDEPLPFSDNDDGDENNGDEEEERLFLNKAENMVWSTKYRSTGWNENRDKFDHSKSKFNINAGRIRSPKEAFMEFVDKDMLDMIVRFTNSEALAANDTKFKPLCVDELLAWLACSMVAGLMGANHTSVRYLWTTDPVYGTRFFRAVMSLERYQLICRYIRFDDSVARRLPRQIGQPSASNYVRSSDRLALVRPIVTIFQRNFCSKYYPGENVAVDERMVSFRGRVIFKVYSKGKPDPYGIKIFGLSDAENAYFSNFDIYTGK